jgi:hypothetical protein
MNKDEFRKYVIETITKSPFGYRKTIAAKGDLVREYLNKDLGFVQGLYHIINNIDDVPKCSVCNNNTVFHNIKKGYGKVCSSKCASLLGAASQKKKSKEEYIDANQKRKITNNEKYGVDHILQRKDFKEKQENTMKSLYGVKHAVHSELLMDKIINTNNEKYGVDCFFETDISRKNSSDNITKRHSENFFENYFMNNFGVKSWHETEDYFRRYFRSKDSEYLYDDIEKYLTGKTLSEISKKLNITDYMINRLILHKKIDYKPIHFQSSFERCIIKFIENLDPNLEIILNDRTILDGRELDILIPSKNIAIECHGVYWHSEKFKDKNYHYKKYFDAKEKGISLIQITDYHYYRNIKGWEDLLKVKLGYIDNKIFARKCIIKEVDNILSKSFIDKNHIQGYTNSQINLGLFYNEELVSIATFSKPRFNKKHDYELIRFCSRSGTIIIGGFSRLLKYFIKNYMNVGSSIISYSNCFWSNGNVYKNFGFTYEGHSGVNYFWTNGKTVISRYKTQKHKLKEIYGDKVFTEKSFMESNGLYRFYDSGNYIWAYKK